MVDSVAYAIKHTERNVADMGLDIMFELLQVSGLIGGGGGRDGGRNGGRGDGRGDGGLRGRRA